MKNFSNSSSNATQIRNEVSNKSRQFKETSKFSSFEQQKELSSTPTLYKDRSNLEKSPYFTVIGSYRGSGRAGW